MGLIWLDVGDLIAKAGGNPWATNRSLQADRRVSRRIMIAVAATSLIATCACTKSHADSVFPHPSGYPRVNVFDYGIALPNPPHDPTNAIYFLTPEGIPCNFHTGSVACIPGVPDNAKNPYTSVSTGSGIQAATSTPYSDGSIQGHPLKALPPQQALAAGGTFCGVDASGATACKDSQGRGFVISQQGTRWLPHV